jgi:hypothetical protein
MKKNRRKKDKGWEPRFMFTKNGMVQLWEQEGHKGMLVTETRGDAERFAAFWKDTRGEEVTIAEIGAIEGETAEAQFAASVTFGADCMWMIRFNGDEIMLHSFTSTHWRVPLGDPLYSDKDHPIPVNALFDDYTGPNLSKDPRKAFADAQVIFGVDVMSQREFLVYGRKALEEIVKSGKTQMLSTIHVAIDQETDELEKLVALVHVVKGHDDYQADEDGPVPAKPNDDRAAKTFIIFSHFNNLTSESDEVRDATLQTLREADVIVAANQGIPPFYGKEWLEEVAAGKIDETVVTKMVVVGLDAGEVYQQAKELRKIVEELKGSCCYTTEEPYLCMFIGKEGSIQHWVQDGKTGIIVAATREMAKEFAAWLKKYKGTSVSIADIGSVQGEASEQQFDGSVETGANCVWCLQSIEGNKVVCELWKPVPKP